MNRKDSIFDEMFDHIKEKKGENIEYSLHKINDAYSLLKFKFHGKTHHIFVINEDYVTTHIHNLEDYSEALEKAIFKIIGNGDPGAR